MPVYQDLENRDYALSASFDRSVHHYLKLDKDTNRIEFKPKPDVQLSFGIQSRLIRHVLSLYKGNGDELALFSRTHNQILTYESRHDPALTDLFYTILAKHNVSNIPLHIDIATDGLLEAQRPQFAKWDGTYRAFNLLDDFFTLDTQVSGTDDEANQMRLAFYTALLTHVAILNNVTTITNETGQTDVSSSIGYSLIPVIVSTDKNIGKSTFVNRLLNAITIGGVAETDLLTICDPQKRGRLYHSNHALILDELNPFQVVKNTIVLKSLATQTRYDYDQKYEQVVTLPRKTMLVATTNNPKDDFAIHETDRRMQFISVRGRDDRKNADTYPFEQIWAELNYFVQRMSLTDIRKLTQWSEDLTIQNVTNNDDDFKSWLYEQTNLLFTPNEFENMVKRNPQYANTVVYKDGKIITSNQYYELRLFDKTITPIDRQKEVLESLNIKFSTNDNRISDYSVLSLRRRISSFIARQVSGETKDFLPVRVRAEHNNRFRGYAVSQKHTHETSNTVNQSVITSRLNLLRSSLNSSIAKPTRSTSRLLDNTYVTDVNNQFVKYSEATNVDITSNETRVHIKDKNLIEFMTRIPIPDEHVHGFQFMRQSQRGGLNYYHYIGLVSDENQRLLSNWTRKTNEFTKVIYTNAITSAHGDYIFINQTLDTSLTTYNRLQFDQLEVNAIVPFIAETFNHVLSPDFEKHEQLYHIRYADIFKSDPM